MWLSRVKNLGRYFLSLSALVLTFVLFQNFSPSQPPPQSKKYAAYIIKPEGYDSCSEEKLSQELDNLKEFYIKQSHGKLNIELDGNNDTKPDIFVVDIPASEIENLLGEDDLCYEFRIKSYEYIAEWKNRTGNTSDVRYDTVARVYPSVAGTLCETNGFGGGANIELINHAFDTQLKNSSPSLRVFLRTFLPTSFVQISPKGDYDPSTQRYKFPKNQRVRVTAKPNSDYEFIGWDGACNHKEFTCTIDITHGREILPIFRHKVSGEVIGQPSDKKGCGLQRTLYHELGHVLGMGHAAADNNGDGKVINGTKKEEADDSSSIMGYGTTPAVGFNGPEKLKQGWISADKVLTITKSGEYNLSYLEDAVTSYPKIIRFQIPGDEFFYYISIRRSVPNQQEAHFNQRFSNKISVHRDKSTADDKSLIIDFVLLNNRPIWNEAIGFLTFPDDKYSEPSTGLSVERTSTNSAFAKVRIILPTEDQLKRLIVTKTGDGQGQIISTSSGINCLEECQTRSLTFNNTTEVTLRVSPHELSLFKGWQGGGCTGDNPVCTINVNRLTKVSAKFEKKVLLIETTKSQGGLVTSDAASLACGQPGKLSNDLSGFNSESNLSVCRTNAVITSLFAIAADNYKFAGWEGITCDSTELTRNEMLGKCYLILNQSVKFRARFIPAAIDMNSLRPNHLSSRQPLKTKVILKFNLPVVKGKGNIVLSSQTSSKLVIPVTSSHVLISSDKKTVTITPPSNLAGNTRYSVSFANGVFVDSSKKSILGISDKDWVFTTTNK